MTDQPGETIEFRELPEVTQEQLVAYAKASGDHNPIHQDEAVARAAGLPGIIAHGMLSAAFVAERAVVALEEWPELQGFSLRRFQCRFKAMVFPGDKIAVGGKVKERSDSRLVLELQALNPQNDLVTLGTAEFSRNA
jgi:acyl dehydratase